MTAAPILHIIFYLATLFLPVDATKFTATFSDGKIEWAKQADGWHATAGGKDMGVWSADKMTVSVTKDGETKKTDVSKFVTDQSTVAERKISFEGKPVAVAKGDHLLTLTQEKDGFFSGANSVTLTWPK